MKIEIGKLVVIEKSVGVNRLEFGEDVRVDVLMCTLCVRVSSSAVYSCS